MGRLKWNPQTGRFDSAIGIDSPPAGTPVGGQYVDEVTGETKQKMVTGVDVVLSPATTTTAPKKTSPSTTTAPTTTTPKGTTPTTVPKRTTPTTVPKAGTTTPTTVAPAGGKGKVNISGKGMGGPTAAQVQAGQFVGSPAQVADTNNAINKAIEEALKGGDYKGAMELIAALSASGSGGGSSGPSAAETAAATAKANADSYRAAMAAAQQQEASGESLQKAYNAQAGTLFDTQSAAIKKYYGDQATTAGQTIKTAGENFLKQLPQATAYANAQVANLPQAQQGLSEALRTYGATTGQADEQSAQSKAYLDALAKMQASSNQQLQTADTTYMDALRTAGTGANTAAQQALTGNIAQLQAGDMSNVTSAQQALIQKGIEAVLAGQTEAASTRANATATYGVPKKTKPPRKPKK
jgi:hypothetical protein